MPARQLLTDLRVPSLSPRLQTMCLLGFVAMAVNIVGVIGLFGPNFCYGVGSITDQMTDSQRAQYESMPEAQRQQFEDSLASTMGSMPCSNVMGAGFMGMIALLVGLIALPSTIGLAVTFYTHARPKAVLIGSQQLTDQVRAKLSKPFQVKYANFITGALYIATFVILIIQFKTVSWPGIMFLISGVFFVINLGLTFKHFSTPGVPQSLDLGFGGANNPGGVPNAGKGAKFDPNTGQPIPKFDPTTGAQNW